MMHYEAACQNFLTQDRNASLTWMTVVPGGDEGAGEEDEEEDAEFLLESLLFLKVSSSSVT